MKLQSFFLLVYISCQLGFSQIPQLSDNSTISVLTFGPGQSLNDAFGHNAFRITDRTRGIDLVYGYGEYDFEAPFFYLKFAQGKLNYLLSRHRFKDIYRAYSARNRSISEQVLSLNALERQSLFEYLENNYKPENRKYRYDFFYDNCATRIRDVAEHSISSEIIYTTPNDFNSKTFRELIYEHVSKNSWGSLGIDIALGSVIDQNATPREYMFLPKYIHSFFSSASIGQEKTLVKSSRDLYQEKETQSSFWNILISPLIILSILGIYILFRTYKDHTLNQRSRWLDVSLSSLTGFIGIVLSLLWFATDHTATAYNYNLLWAFPFNLLLVEQLRKSSPKRWTKGYLKFLLVMLSLMTLHWLIGVQVFALTLIPLILALVVRYIYVLKTL